uniref:Uncharacterized protein n=1 Tax=Glossina palpalis gambiensis TaxID=67801 RepID=A0A1B0AS01_9MUSC
MLNNVGRIASFEFRMCLAMPFHKKTFISVLDYVDSFAIINQDFKEVNRSRHGLLGKHNLLLNRKMWTRTAALYCCLLHKQPTISNENDNNKEDTPTSFFMTERLSEIAALQYNVATRNPAMIQQGINLEVLPLGTKNLGGLSTPSTILRARIKCILCFTTPSARKISDISNSKYFPIDAHTVCNKICIPLGIYSNKNASIWGDNICSASMNFDPLRDQLFV